MTKLTSVAFLGAAFAAIDTIYLKGKGGKVSDRDLHKAEGKAEQVFDDRMRQFEEVEIDESNVSFTPDYDTERLHIHIQCGKFNMSNDLYLGDYGVDLINTDGNEDTLTV